ncbi:MAG: hypothetical protein CM15mP23_22730 [Cryomorphaceae bacterium]|nr:MAG: hypothetical protein CM15mP23_22730 [Cryomorphaceae bacterium]
MKILKNITTTTMVMALLLVSSLEARETKRFQTLAGLTSLSQVGHLMETVFTLMLPITVYF